MLGSNAGYKPNFVGVAGQNEPSVVSNSNASIISPSASVDLISKKFSEPNI